MHSNDLVPAITEVESMREVRTLMPGSQFRPSPPCFLSLGSLSTGSYPGSAGETWRPARVARESSPSARSPLRGRHMLLLAHCWQTSMMLTKRLPYTKASVSSRSALLKHLSEPMT